MDDRRDHPTPPPEGEASDLRLGRHAIGLLEAARAIGDPTLIAQAEAVAFTAGQLLAERMRRTYGRMDN